MNPLIQLKKVTLAFSLALACFTLLQRAQAVVPPPDGGYGPPAYGTGNSAEGQDALLSLTTGTYNTAIGYLSLRSNATGTFNTAIGAGALLNNTGERNTATGAGALVSNTTGEFNTAVGESALFFNTTGNENTATAAGALLSNITGSFNTANGFEALRSNTTGSNNTATGFQALLTNTGSDNTATGFNALLSNTTGSSNTANGRAALTSNTTGTDNTAIGRAALGNNTTARSNTAIGRSAFFNSTSSNNTGLGFNAGLAVTTASNVICIGANVIGANVSNTCYIGNIFGATSSGGTAVFINSRGQLGTSTSSQRFKDDIKPMDKASETLFALTPVSFRYKREFEPTGESQFGLVAEDVEKVNPDLVVRDKEGKPYSVRYDQVNAMLLNEFLKEHRKVEQLERRIEVLTAGLQKVNAQLEARKPAPQVALNADQD
jgi:hypothetical protein